MAFSPKIISEMLSVIGLKKFLDGHSTQTEFYSKWYWMYASVGQITKDLKIYDVNGTNALGDTPLITAIKCKRNIMVLNTLLAFGADITTKNNAGKTANDFIKTTYKWRKSDLYYGDYDIAQHMAQHIAQKNS